MIKLLLFILDAFTSVMIWVRVSPGCAFVTRSENSLALSFDSSCSLLGNVFEYTFSLGFVSNTLSNWLSI